VIEFGEGASFASETRRKFPVGGQILRQDLQGHIAIQPLVVGAIDSAHASGPDLFEDPIM